MTTITRSRWAARPSRSGNKFQNLLAPASAVSDTRFFDGANSQTATTRETTTIDSAATSEDNETALSDILVTTLFTDTEAARAAVGEGTFVGALLIPPGFSAAMLSGMNAMPAGVMQPLPAGEEAEEGAIEFFTNPSSAIRADIAESIIEAIGTQMQAGAIAVGAGINAVIARGLGDVTALAEAGTLMEDGDFVQEFFQADGSGIALQRLAMSGKQATFNPFALFGTSQAIFFMLFTAMATAAEFMREKRNGILARLLATPTPISTIIVGKIAASTMVCATQVAVLLVALYGSAPCKRT